MIVDRQGRRFRNLRISLTAACNYACTYCVPDGKRLVAAQDELSAEAMVRGVAYLIEAAGIERDACALVCDELAELCRASPTDSMWQWGECAAAIRARGQKEGA